VPRQPLAKSLKARAADSAPDLAALRATARRLKKDAKAASKQAKESKAALKHARKQAKLDKRAAKRLRAAAEAAARVYASAATRPIPAGTARKPEQRPRAASEPSVSPKAARARSRSPGRTRVSRSTADLPAERRARSRDGSGRNLRGTMVETPTDGPLRSPATTEDDLPSPSLGRCSDPEGVEHRIDDAL
jgi:hypothetical protein